MLLGADPFSIYGTGSGGRANMLRNPLWLEVGDNVAPSTSDPRSSIGTHCLDVAASNNNGPRVSLFGNKTEFIMRSAFKVASLPTGNAVNVIYEPHDNANAAQCALVLTSTGSILLRKGSLGGGGVTLAETDGPVIAAGSYYHVEAYFKIGDAGACEVRVNGVVVMNATGIDTQNTANGGADQVRVFTAAVTSVGYKVTDFAVADMTGDDNNDFMGDVVYIRRDMVATDASTWTRNTGASDHAAVDDPTPDDDTTYVAADAPADAVQFQLQSLPASVSEVVSVSLAVLNRKADAGVGSLQTSLASVAVSPVQEDDGEEVAQTQTYAYQVDHFGADPSTGVPVTPASYPDLRVRHVKTA